MEVSHRARLAPFQPETVWTLEAGALVETRGKVERRFPLSGLTRYSLAVDRTGGRRRSLLLTFGRRRLSIASQSYLGPGQFEDRLTSFSTLARAIAAVAQGRKEVVDESADLLFHLLLLWKSTGVTPEEVMTELKRREEMSGIEEKNSRPPE